MATKELNGAFTDAALGVPDMNNGNWLTMDLSGKGFLPNMQPLQSAPDMSASPKPGGFKP
jgi:hypothetical protein